MEYIGRAHDILHDGETQIYVARLERLTDWRSLSRDPLWQELVEASEAGFALFIAGDWTQVSDEANEFARYCINHGVFWVSTWGPDCESAHDLFDWIDLEDHGPNDPVVMTLWHANEPLHTAMNLFFSAFPDEGKAPGPARIALSFGEPDWTDAIRRVARNESDLDDP